MLAPGDRSSVTLDVQNFTGKAGEFKVQLDGIGPLSLTDAVRTVKLGVEGKTTYTFPLVAREGYTIAQVRVRVAGNGYQVDRKYDVPVRPAWSQVMRTRTKVLNDLAAVQLDRDLSEGLMSNSVHARMVVSALPPIPFAAALEDALKYPYGCAEQTASKGYAALELDEATAKMLGVTGLSAKLRRERMEGAFGRLAAMQISSGHFSMWGEGDYVNQSLTPYIVEFLLDAREAGFAVPENMLQKALKALNEDLLAGGAPFYGYDHRDHMKFAYQAHAGYALARVNRAPLGTLRALYDNSRKQSLTGLPLVHLGLGLSLQGDRNRGAKSIAAGFAFDSKDRPQYLGDYGTHIRDDALMIALVHERGFDKPEYDTRVVALGRELDARRKERWFWLSTQEQVALARLGKALMADQAKLVSGQWKVGDDASDIAATRITGRLFDYDALARGVRFIPQGQAPLYASLEVAGVPRSAPEPDTSVVTVTRKYYNTDGSEWSGGTLEEGDSLIAQLSIKGSVNMPDALVTDLLPAGLEIENFNLGDAKQWVGVVVDGIEIADRDEAAEVRHEEYRDDRYVAALKLSTHDTAKLFYLVRAVTPGTYTVPPSLVEDMYRPDLRGVGKASPATLAVKQPGR